MPTVTLADRTYESASGETVLTTLLRQGEEIPHSCRSGVCRSCLLRATHGTPPSAAQKPLKDTLKAQGYFLGCLATPETDLTVALPTDGVIGHVRATLLSRETLAPEIFRLVLQTDTPFIFFAGQFVTVRHPDGQRRSYSLAAPPSDESTLELHVRALPQGLLSQWLTQELEIGASIDIFGPEGNSFYLPGNPEQPLLLIGTGTGLAPLLGVIRDALRQSHTGPIQLFHGSHVAEGLYLQDDLMALTTQHTNLNYTPCISSHGPRADVAAFERVPKTTGWRIYLCGHPEMVQRAQRKAFLLGASLSDIYTDPFVRATAIGPVL